jgi:flagellar basal-body rod protein FlgC
MDIFKVMDIGSSALKAQTTRMNVISSNLANMETTRTPEGGPYKKKAVVFTTSRLDFGLELDQSLQQQDRQGVRVDRIMTDDREPKKVYDPAHPDAGPEGYVKKPNIKLAEEMTDMMKAKGSYEANVVSIKSAQRMAVKALEIGR